jgi:citrate lyase beta subunit
MVAWNGVRFVVGADGQPTAVQVDMDVWEQIIAALEDAEDVALARTALTELEAAGGDPDKAGWLRLEDVQKDWEADDTA